MTETTLRAIFCRTHLQQKQRSFRRLRRATQWRSLPGAGTIRHINKRHQQTVAVPGIGDIGLSPK
jgi:hypothetical protein